MYTYTPHIRTYQCGDIDISTHTNEYQDPEAEREHPAGIQPLVLEGSVCKTDVVVVWQRP